MSSSSEISLHSFFVFNPSLAKTEGEEEKKILYYYPKEIDADHKLKSAGLCEALIKFTASFRPDKQCEVFTTEKSKQFLYEAEPGYWIVMTVLANPTVSKVSSEDSSSLIQDNICSSILRLAYQMFRIFNGSFQSIIGDDELDDEKLQLLIEKLSQFYENYLLQINLDTSSVLDVFNGIQFLPLGREPFLHLQSFINLVEVKFSPVQYSAFLYNDQLVWSGIDPSDMQVLYHYLVHSLLPSHPDLELQGGSLSGSSVTVHYGSFVTGPPNLQDSVISSKKVPKVYLKNGKETEVFHLVVYHALSATLCLFLKESTSLSLPLFQALDEHIGPRLTTLVSEISEHNSPASSAEIGPRFIYFNNLNLAIKSSIFEPRKGAPQALAPDVMRILASLNAGKEQFCDNGEVIVKTLSDTWIVVKFSNNREFYVVAQKKASLMEIEVEVKKITDTQLCGIFFMD